MPIALLMVLAAASNLMGQVSLLSLQGEPEEVFDLWEGRWALAFVVPSRMSSLRHGHPLAEGGEGNFSRNSSCSRSSLEKRRTSEGGGLPVLLDEGGRFGAALGVRKAPTLLFFVEGTLVGKIAWPFSENLLLQQLMEVQTLLAPSPKDFLSQPAPDFQGVSLMGKGVGNAELPKPLLLAFLTLGCAPCWEVLPVLQELSREVPVVLVAGVEPQGLASEERARLNRFLMEVQSVGGKAWVLLDLGVEGYPLARAFRVRRSPTFLLLDGKGVVVGAWVRAGEKWIEEIRVN